MAYLEIQRAGPLAGSLPVQGSKNTVLPILAASLLCPGQIVLTNVPRIRDVENMLYLMRKIGCRVKWEGSRLFLDASVLTDFELAHEAARSMRSSVSFLAPLLSRCKRARLYEPGGCSLGQRPIDLHIEALGRMGAVFSFSHGRIDVSARELRGTDVVLRFPSVGATEQAVTAAACAKGVTRILNCAKEPEVAALCDFLCAMGARIEGIGTSCLEVYGVDTLHGTEYEICADRIAAATFMSAVAVCGGRAQLLGIHAKDMAGITDPFIHMGCEVEFGPLGMEIQMAKKPAPISYIETGPYPGFPTDVQSLLLAVLACSGGHSVVKEKIFDARFRAAYQLQKMGADIIIKENCAYIGPSSLRGCTVEAPDLRGGAALVIAGLAAEGTTYVTGYGHICRGYEDIAGNLRRLGAYAVLHEKERAAMA